MINTKLKRFFTKYLSSYSYLSLSEREDILSMLPFSHKDNSLYYHVYSFLSIHFPNVDEKDDLIIEHLSLSLLFTRLRMLDTIKEEEQKKKNYENLLYISFQTFDQMRNLTNKDFYCPYFKAEENLYHQDKHPFYINISYLLYLGQNIKGYENYLDKALFYAPKHAPLLFLSLINKSKHNEQIKKEEIIEAFSNLILPQDYSYYLLFLEEYFFTRDLKAYEEIKNFTDDEHIFKKMSPYLLDCLKKENLPYQYNQVGINILQSLTDKEDLYSLYYKKLLSFIL